MNSDENTPVALYSKRSGVDIQWLPSTKEFRIVSEMEDGHHRMRLTMVVDKASSLIREIGAEMPGVPDPLCRKATDLLAGLVGKPASPGIMRELGGDWDRAGCTHIKDVFRAGCYGLTQAHAARGREELTALFPGLTEEQLYKIFFWFRPDMQGSCIRYSDGSPFLDQVRAASVPEGAERIRATIPRPGAAGNTERGST